MHILSKMCVLLSVHVCVCAAVDCTPSRGCGRGCAPLWVPPHTAPRRAPGHFEPDAVQADTGDSWMLRSLNLKKVANAVQRYYFEVLGTTVQFDAVDFDAAAKDEQPAQLLPLVERTLIAAVQCDDKAYYIQQIMELDHEAQAQLMLVINEAMSSEPSHTPPGSPSLASQRFGALCASSCNLTHGWLLT